MECNACPFALTYASEHVQNLGCLPSGYQVIEMKKKSNQNWACHEDEHKLCYGLASSNKDFRLNLNLKEGNLISYEDWYYKGEEEAMRIAENRGKKS